MTFSIELVVMEVTNIKGRALEFQAQISRGFGMGFFGILNRAPGHPGSE